MVIHTIYVNLNSEKYLNLHPYNLYNIVVKEEKIPPCKYYRDGLLPGMKPHPNNKMMYCKIRSFRNFLEHSKITAEDVKIVDNEKYLLMKYFHRREIAWKNRKLIKKKGEVLAYYIDGCICDEKQFLETIRDIFKDIYLSLRHLYYPLIKMKRKLGNRLKIKVVDNLDDELKKFGLVEILEELFNSL